MAPVQRNQRMNQSSQSPFGGNGSIKIIGFIFLGLTNHPLGMHLSFPHSSEGVSQFLTVFNSSQSLVEVGLRGRSSLCLSTFRGNPRLCRLGRCCCSWCFQSWLKSSGRGTDVSPPASSLAPPTSGFQPSVVALVEEVDDLLCCLEQHLDYLHGF